MALGQEVAGDHKFFTLKRVTFFILKGALNPIEKIFIYLFKCQRKIFLPFCHGRIVLTNRSAD